MDDDKTSGMSDSQPPKPSDPLGIIGWVIGGKYKIHSHIGGGGFGEVYDAHNVNLVEQRLVIKFFKRVQARDRFDREARILCLLDHPNISRVVDYLPDEGALVIQFIDGKDGAQILRERGSLPPDVYLRVARAVTSAIAYAHDRKIAHRDVKPGNVIIDRNGNVYLIDFGIAKEMGGVATQTGYQSLTPMFAAPERQAGGRDYNPFLSDVYETGITLFNFATNSMPYRNPVAPSLDEWGGPAARTLSSPLRQILKKATHPDPSQRYQNAAEMAVDFDKLTHVYATRSVVMPVAIGAAVVLVAAAAWFGRGRIAGLVGANDEPQQTAQTVDTAKQVTPVQQISTPVKQSPAPAATPTAPRSADTAAPKSAPPVTPQVPGFVINVEPSGITVLTVDDTARMPGQEFETSTGRHEVVIVHPRYPVLRRQVNVTEQMTRRTFDLRREYAKADTVGLQLAMNPYSENYVLVVQTNGAAHRYTQFPVLDLDYLVGTWQLELDIQPVNTTAQASPKVDSCVAYPYGGGPRRTMIGPRGTIELLPGENGNALPLLVFWSE